MRLTFLAVNCVLLAVLCCNCLLATAATVRPYKFGFTIEEQQHRREQRDEQGIVMGEFGFITADGIYHVTVYATDENGKFRIISMKNYPYAGPVVPKTVPALTTTTTTTTTTTGKPLPKQNFNTAACSGCFLTKAEAEAGPNTLQNQLATGVHNPKTEIRPLSQELPAAVAVGAAAPGKLLIPGLYTPQSQKLAELAVSQYQNQKQAQAQAQGAPLPAGVINGLNVQLPFQQSIAQTIDAALAESQRLNQIHIPVPSTHTQAHTHTQAQAQTQTQTLHTLLSPSTFKQHDSDNTLQLQTLPFDLASLAQISPATTVPKDLNSHAFSTPVSKAPTAARVDKNNVELSMKKLVLPVTHEIDRLLGKRPLGDHYTATPPQYNVQLASSSTQYAVPNLDKAHEINRGELNTATQPQNDGQLASSSTQYAVPNLDKAHEIIRGELNTATQPQYEGQLASSTTQYPVSNIAAAKPASGQRPQGNLYADRLTSTSLNPASHFANVNPLEGAPQFASHGLQGVSYAHTQTQYNGKPISTTQYPSSSLVAANPLSNKVTANQLQGDLFAHTPTSASQNPAGSFAAVNPAKGTPQIASHGLQGVLNIATQSQYNGQPISTTQYAVPSLAHKTHEINKGELNIATQSQYNGQPISTTQYAVPNLADKTHEINKGELSTATQPQYHGQLASPATQYPVSNFAASNPLTNKVTGQGPQGNQYSITPLQHAATSIAQSPAGSVGALNPLTGGLQIDSYGVQGVANTVAQPQYNGQSASFNNQYPVSSSTTQYPASKFAAANPSLSKVADQRPQGDRYTATPTAGFTASRPLNGNVEHSMKKLVLPVTHEIGKIIGQRPQGDQHAVSASSPSFAPNVLVQNTGSFVAKRPQDEQLGVALPNYQAATTSPHSVSSIAASNPFNSNVLGQQTGGKLRPTQGATFSQNNGGPATPTSPHFAAANRLNVAIPVANRVVQLVDRKQGDPITAQHTQYNLQNNLHATPAHTQSNTHTTSSTAGNAPSLTATKTQQQQGLSPTGNKNGLAQTATNAQGSPLTGDNKGLAQGLEKPTLVGGLKPLLSNSPISGATGGQTQLAKPLLSSTATKTGSAQSGSGAGQTGDLYRFKYLLDYNGHEETGSRNGNKEGNYFAIGEDEVVRTIEYIANEFGFQPHISWRKLDQNEISELPKENSLKHYEFKWFNQKPAE